MPSNPWHHPHHAEGTPRSASDYEAFLEAVEGLDYSCAFYLFDAPRACSSVRGQHSMDSVGHTVCSEGLNGVIWSLFTEQTFSNPEKPPYICLRWLPLTYHPVPDIA